MKKRSVRIAGHATSISLEEEFWDALKDIAKHHGKSASTIISEIDEGRGEINLSSALRLYVLRDMKRRLNDRP